MEKNAVACLLLLLGLVQGCSDDVPKVSSDARPNIIHIMADDLGYGDLGSYGQQLIKTPNLDQLAREGMRFTQYYAGSAACTPARYALLTGKHAGSTRVIDNAINTLPENTFTIARLLQASGYRTGLIGKWALGEMGSSGYPLDQGFDYFFGYPSQRLAHNYFPETLMENREVVTIPANKGSHGASVAPEKSVNAASLIHRAALAFITAERGQPFYLQLDYNLPHVNNELKDATGNGYEMSGPGRYSDRGWTESERDYAEMVSLIDDYVAGIVEQLKASGLAQNTLVIFTSDNGPASSRGQSSLIDFQATAGLRGNKGMLWEGGIRVPMIAWWPGNIPAGTNDSVLAFWDWAATLAQLVGYTDAFETDGTSFRGLLAGGNDFPKKREMYWELHGWKAVRLGDWKWLVKPNGDEFLFNLKQDPRELQNVNNKYPKIAKKLGALARYDSQPTGIDPE